VLLTFFAELALTVLGVILGGYALLAGRRKLWASLGVIGFSVTSNMVAILLVSLNSGWELAGDGRWLLLLVAIGVGTIGIIIGRSRVDLAVTLVGFATGADVALLLYQISFYVFTAVAHLPENVALWLGVALIFVGGLLGVQLTRRYRDEALILITTIIGVEVIVRALKLSGTSSLTAVFVLSLCLVGVVVQYADYLRHIKADPQRRPTGPALPEIFPPDYFA